jgi:hypothetical protein
MNNINHNVKLRNISTRYQDVDLHYSFTVRSRRVMKLELIYISDTFFIWKKIDTSAYTSSHAFPHCVSWKVGEDITVQENWFPLLFYPLFYADIESPLITKPLSEKVKSVGILDSPLKQLTVVPKVPSLRRQWVSWNRQLLMVFFLPKRADKVNYARSDINYKT